MKIPLNEFEQYIDETILKRGLQYFKKGYVDDVEEISHNQYEATVHGSEAYTVTLDLDNGVITDSTCDCPYDYGAFCKHQVALMFYLQKDILTLDITEAKHPKEKKTAKPKAKTEAQLLDEIMQKLSHDDLQYFISEQCANNKTFRQQFIGRYIALLEGESKTRYDKQVKAVFKSFKDRSGYVSYRDAGRLNSAMQELIMQADKLLHEKRWNSAWMLSLSIFEEAVEALQYSDDSNGDIGDLCEQSISYISELIETKPDEKLRLEIFQYCVNAFKRKLFYGWDYHWQMFDFAMALAASNEENQLLMAMLEVEKPNKKDYSENYEYEQALQLKMQMIRRLYGEDKALEFEAEHLFIQEFRVEAIGRAIKAKDYKHATQLCLDGIAQDEKDSPGLVKYWEDFLLKIYEASKQNNKIIQLARKRFKDGWYAKRENYDLLKKYIPQAEWKVYLSQLLEEIKKSKFQGLMTGYADVYIWEQDWANLYQVLLKQPTFNNLDAWADYLMPDYKNDIIQLYKKVLLESMEYNMGRTAYQTSCRYLRRLKKMGAVEEVEEIVQQFRILYPKRKALMEELDAL